MPATSSKGKGNRRTGRTKGNVGRRGQLPWQDDPSVLKRIELVSDLFHYPLSTILDAVNLSLQREGKEPISYSTLKVDRERARELLRERVGRGMETHMERLQEVIQDAWRSLRRTPEGPARAPLYAVIIRGVEDQAKLDGSWGSVSAPPLQYGPDDSTFGPSPQELLEAGEISREDYRAWLLVLHRHSGGQQARPVNAQVVEGKALPVPAPEARGPQIKRGGNGARPTKAPPSMPSMGDDLPNVVDWDPETSE